MTDEEITEFIKKETKEDIECVFKSDIFNSFKFLNYNKGNFIFDKGFYNKKGEFVKKYSDSEMQDYLKMRCQKILTFLRRVKY